MLIICCKITVEFRQIFNIEEAVSKLWVQVNKTVTPKTYMKNKNKKQLNASFHENGKHSRNC